MARALIICLLMLLALLVWFAGPFVSFGFFQPFETPMTRMATVIALLLVALGLVISSVIRRRRGDTTETKSARDNFHSVWRSIGLLWAPVALLAAISIVVIEAAYRNIKQINTEMQETLDQLRERDPGVTFTNLQGTNEVLTQVYGLTLRDEAWVNLPLLDSKTDRQYLLDHYDIMLSNHLRPHLMQRLEEHITSSLGDGAALYETLKVYLMLGQEGPMDVEYALGWIEADLLERLPGVLNQELRDDLLVHTGSLLRSGRWNEYPVRADLVMQAREQLAQYSPGSLLYIRIMSDPLVTTLPDWRLTDVGGPTVSRVIIRASGKRLSDGIPGIFTRNGFHRVFQRLLNASVELQMADDWILGASGDMSGSNASQIADEAFRIYSNEFINRWNDLLDDLDLVPVVDGLSNLVETTNVLSGLTSPVYKISQSVADETRLTDVSEVESVNNKASLRLADLARIAQFQRPGAAPTQDGAEIEQQFSALHDFMEGTPSPAQSYLAELSEIYRELNKMALSGNVSPEASDRVTAQLQQLRISSPPMVARWTSQLLGAYDRVSSGDSRARLNAQWQSEVLPFCQQATLGRFPFDRQATRDISLADFSRLFGPGGLVDRFYNENLAGMVDQRTRLWAWRGGASFSPDTLTEFTRAAQIRQAFFRDGRDLGIAFQITPEALDPKARAVTLSIAGQDMRFTHTEPSVPKVITWPQSENSAEVTMDTSVGTPRLRKEGNWALFRLLNATELRRTNVPDRFRMIANVEGFIAIFQLQTSSTENPFTLKALSEFRCPLGF